MIDNCNINNLAKNQVSTVFDSRAILIQIYRDLYGDAMLVPIRIGTNMAAGNRQKHLSLSFVLSRNSKTLK